jgi:hypothetical protein
MRTKTLTSMGLGAVLLVSGCGTVHRKALDAEQAQQAKLDYNLTRAQEDRILRLNASSVSGADVRGALRGAPAPRMILIHGGLSTVIDEMESFADFLVGMGYPRSAIGPPGQRNKTFSCLERADMIAGMSGWFYEREGLRPMIVGHSQGGFQVVKILNTLDRAPSHKTYVWNPVTWEKEERWEITDPRTGKQRRVSGLKLPYAASVGAGGLTRMLPNQWGMIGNLRSIPNSVEEFTGFYTGMDPLGGDMGGWGPANHSKSMGSAKVRNVELPVTYRHGKIPDTKHLARSSETRDWINNWRPPNKSFYVAKLDREFRAKSAYILFAADVWYSIKKAWVRDLQQLIRARRRMR